MKLGIAGLDENRRITQAKVGLAGEIRGKSLSGAAYGIAGVNTHRITNTAKYGISGLDRMAKVDVARTGFAGNINGNCRSQVIDQTGFKHRDEALSQIGMESNRLGDRAARTAWSRGVWFASYEFITKLTSAGITWKAGRGKVFERQNRDLPLFIDSAAYRRVLSGTAPNWCRQPENYYAAIEFVDPDGYPWFDNPKSRAETMQIGQEMMELFPNDSRMWPVFSVRWAWNKSAHLDYAALPREWVSSDLSYLIPQNKTQRRFKDSTRDRWAREAIANAILASQDPDLRWMVEKFGKVMIGGMVKGPCNRAARHLYAATLAHIFPDTHFWLLGQANYAVVNGLGMLGLLDRIWTDGTWWLLDATCDRFAYVEDGLITMASFESDFRMQLFFTLVEMMAANLRSLLAAYEGLWSWPPPEPLPLNLMDPDDAGEMKRRLHVAQMELGL